MNTLVKQLFLMKEEVYSQKEGAYSQKVPNFGEQRPPDLQTTGPLYNNGTYSILDTLVKQLSL